MSIMQAGSINIKSPGVPVTDANDLSNFETVTFPTPFPDGSNIIVIPMVQTFNGVDTPGVRVADVTTTGFKVRMNEVVVTNNHVTEPLSGGKHVTETLGWVAYSV